MATTPDTTGAAPGTTSRLRLLLTIGIPVVALLIIAAFAVPQIYANAMNGQADTAPTIATDGSPSTTVDLTAYEGQWTVGTGSFAGYRLEEVLNGADVTVTGRTEGVTGNLTVAGGQLTVAAITVDMTTIATDNSGRDTYFRSVALNTAENPTATFAITSPVSLPALSNTPVTVEVPGDLTINGTTKQVTISLQVAVDAEQVQVVGSAPLTFADFGVTAPDLGFVKVEPTGSAEFSLALTRA